MSSFEYSGGSLTQMRASEAAVSPVADVVHRLGSDCSQGLLCEEVGRRQQLHGLNEFEIREEDPLWRKYLNQVSTPAFSFPVSLWPLAIFVSCVPSSRTHWLCYCWRQPLSVCVLGSLMTPSLSQWWVYFLQDVHYLERWTILLITFVLHRLGHRYCGYSGVYPGLWTTIYTDHWPLSLCI